MPLFVRRAVVAFVLAMAAIVLVHAATCAVVHPGSMTAEAIEHPTVDHFPDAVLMTTAVLVGLALLVLRRMVRCSRVGVIPLSSAAWATGPWARRGPPSAHPGSPSVSVSLCVFRC